jgi:hypothetical protein
MKPLPVRPLTIEDYVVWNKVLAAWRYYDAERYWDATQAQDRRDAALMLQIETMPKVVGTVFSSGIWSRAHRRLAWDLALDLT